MISVAITDGYGQSVSINLFVSWGPTPTHCQRLASLVAAVEQPSTAWIGILLAEIVKRALQSAFCDRSSRQIADPSSPL